MTLDGPAIIEQTDTTTVVEPGMTLTRRLASQPTRRWTA